MLPVSVMKCLVDQRGPGSLRIDDAGLLFLLDDEAVKEYLTRCESLLKHFYDARRYFRKNTQASELDGAHAQRNPGGWAGPGMLAIAMLIAARGKKKADEVFIGAGIFMGGSTSCIAPVCFQEGIEYIAADTFEGLPHPSGDGHYEVGQFSGSENEVKKHLADTKSEDGVSFHKGLFSVTLPSLQRPVAGIFLDTDLYESSYSALDSIRDFIDDSTLVFSDGISELHLRDRDKNPTPEHRAINDFLENMGYPTRPTHTLMGYLAVFELSSETGEGVFNQNFFNAFSSILTLRMLGFDAGIDSAGIRDRFLANETGATSYMVNSGLRLLSYRFAG